MAKRATKTAQVDAGEPASAETDAAAAETGKPSRKRPYVLDNQIGFLIRKANQRHLSIFTAHMAEGLTAQQFAVMAKLNEVGPSSQNSLGRQTAMDNSTINGVVARLLERGLVGKVPSPDDKRMHLIQLTPEGQRTIGRVLPMASEITRMTLAPLSRSEQAALVRLLKRLG